MVCCTLGSPREGSLKDIGYGCLVSNPWHSNLIGMGFDLDVGNLKTVSGDSNVQQNLRTTGLGINEKKSG